MTTLLNARILASLGMIVFVAAIAASSTGAFFSDTETSTGNTFTAGDIDLRIDNTSYVTNGAGDLVASPANSWAISDLTNQLFFSFADVKPGDIGEDTISIHPGTNDAYACMAAAITATPDNGINEPEGDAGDISAGDGGELQSFLNFSFWEDDGDNVFEVGEALLPDLQGTAAAIFDGGWNTIADSVNGPALPGNSTTYVGKAWCFGALVANGTIQDGNGSSTPLTRGTTGFTCDGSGNNNIAQTDGINVDVSFYAVQARNNGQFVCSGLPPFVGTSNGPTTVTVNGNSSDWAFNGDRVGDANWTLGIGAFSNGPSTPPLGTGSARIATSLASDREKLRKLIPAGTQISDFTELKYSTYRAEPTGGVLALALQFDVDMDGSPVNPAVADGRIVYEPYHTQTVNDDAWQNWDAMNDAAGTGTGNWWIAGANGPACPQSNPCTWAELNAAYPDMRTSAKSLENADSQGAVMFKAGGSWAGFDGNVDKFVWGINGVSTTYDFEL